MVYIIIIISTRKLKNGCDTFLSVIRLQPTCPMGIVSEEDMIGGRAMTADLVGRNTSCRSHWWDRASSDKLGTIVCVLVLVGDNHV